MILTPLQKLTKNVGDLGKNIVLKCFEWLPKVEKLAQSGHTVGKHESKSRQLRKGNNERPSLVGRPFTLKMYAVS